MKTRIRHILFWFHLLTGVAAGTIIAVLCITGVALAFGKELTSWAERHSWSVSAASDSEPPAALDTISLL
ncbi:MAG: PepSY domain-containing protein, partial [Opitutales bacterium]|nr:PepSY domain-containing protein [Opitutales bacterium]